MAIWLIVSNLNLVQSGGADGAFASMPFVGTAPIVESGSNANGSWIKYADGTMICRGRITTPAGSTVSDGVYMSPAANWNYPQVFVGDAPDLFATVVQVIGGGVFSFGVARLTSILMGLSSSPAQFVIYHKASANVVSVISLLAIGRWKA